MPSVFMRTTKTDQTNWLRMLILSLCSAHTFYVVKIQSTLVISNSKGLSEILRDIRTSTYQICRIEEKIIRTTTFDKYMYNWTLEVRDLFKILWKRGEIGAIFSSFPQYFNLLLDFHV